VVFGVLCEDGLGGEGKEGCGGERGLGLGAEIGWKRGIEASSSPSYRFSGFTSIMGFLFLKLVFSFFFGFQFFFSL